MALGISELSPEPFKSEQVSATGLSGQPPAAGLSGPPSALCRTDQQPATCLEGQLELPDRRSQCLHTRDMKSLSLWNEVRVTSDPPPPTSSDPPPPTSSDDVGLGSDPLNRTTNHIGTSPISAQTRSIDSMYSPIALSTCAIATASQNSPMDSAMQWTRDLTQLMPWIDAVTSPDQITSSQKKNLITTLLQNFEDLFAKNDEDIGCIKGHEHEILLKTDVPVHQRAYRTNPQKQKIIQQLVDKMIRTGRARNARPGADASPVTLAWKKDGSPRLCMDYRKLNQNIVDFKFPLPHIKSLFDRLLHAQFITIVDIGWGYWSLKLTDKSSKIAGFVTEEGLYEPLFMPFGLKCAPADFQRITQEILLPVKDFAFNYLDDICAVTSGTLLEHLQQLHRLFDTLQSAGIKLKPSKTVWLSNKVNYLGFLFDNGTITADPEKVRALAEYAEPSSSKDIERFLGLSGYLSELVPGYTELSYPLLQAKRTMKVGDPLPEEAKQAFNRIRHALSDPKKLNLFDPKLETELYTDASKVGIGALLYQRQPGQKKAQLVSCFSKRLSKEQENWGSTDLESLAVIEAVEHYEYYLKGVEFKVFTDHAALRWIHNSPKLKGKLLRWFNRLAGYTFSIHHRPGRLQQHADALSRNPVEESFPVPYDHECQLGVITDMRDQQTCFFSLAKPKALSLNDIIQAQRVGDMSWIRKPINKDGAIHVKIRGALKTALPSSLIRTVISYYHDHSGHPGVSATARLVSMFYYWPNVCSDISRHVRSCNTCQLTKTFPGPATGELQLMPVGRYPGDLVAMDTIVMGRSASNTAAKYIQMIIDHHTRYIWSVASRTNNASATITALQTALSSVGRINRLLTDNYTTYHSKSLKAFLSSKGITHHFASTYHPETNGMMERANGTIVQKLRAAILEHSSLKWSSLLARVVEDYNNTPHSVTSLTPRFLLLGIQPEGPAMTSSITVDEARAIAIQKTTEAQQKRKILYDKTHSKLKFEVGDLVLRRIASDHPDLMKLTPRNKGPFRVMEQIGPVTYRITDPSDITFQTSAHVSQLRPYRELSPDRPSFSQPGGSVEE